jgi:murein DD-endopeptidase MepM/ murein hydrolase activator NlpD
VRAAGRLLAALLTVALAVPAVAAVTDEELEAARRKLSQLQDEADRVGAELQEAWAESARLDAELDRLTRLSAQNQADLLATQEDLSELAVELYMGMSTSEALAVVVGGSPSDWEAGLEYLRGIRGDTGQLGRKLVALRQELGRQSVRMDEVRAEQAAATSELEDQAESVYASLADAQDSYDLLAEQKRKEDEERRRAAEEARRRAEEAARTSTTRAPAATTAGSPTTGATATTAGGSPATTAGSPTTTQPQALPEGGRCPVDGPNSFSDSWGAPRSGGRAHKGVDMLAPRGTPVAAVFSGSVSRLSTSSLGGITLWVRSSAGDTFYYAHLQGYADGVRAGMAVTEGDVLGFVGTTGNAPPNVPHLHFEFHPGGGAAVNPYPLARRLCR